MNEHTQGGERQWFNGSEDEQNTPDTGSQQGTSHLDGSAPAQADAEGSATRLKPGTPTTGVCVRNWPDEISTAAMQTPEWRKVETVRRTRDETDRLFGAVRARIRKRQGGIGPMEDDCLQAALESLRELLVWTWGAEEQFIQQAREAAAEMMAIDYVRDPRRKMPKPVGTTRRLTTTMSRMFQSPSRGVQSCYS